MLFSKIYFRYKIKERKTNLNLSNPSRFLLTWRLCPYPYPYPDPELETLPGRKNFMENFEKKYIKMCS